MSGIRRYETTDPRQRPSGEDESFGFTLIELLVVVLIIGILAAVAVPQYQKAVDKSKFHMMLPLLKTIAGAKDAYYLATGESARSFDVLGVSLPNDLTYVDDSWYGQGVTWPGKFTIYLDAKRSKQVAGVMSLSDKSTLWFYFPSGDGVTYRQCQGTVNKRAAELCKELPGAVFVAQDDTNILYKYQ